MKLIVNTNQRKAKMRAHTATHLLHYMLDHLLGGTKQAGSLVDEDYLRFDFATKSALTDKQMQTIEQGINQRIAADCPVTISEMSLEEAKELGAKAFFEDKYGDRVRVIHIPTPVTLPGADLLVQEGNSVELCGGTHVSSTGMIGGCKIISQESVGSGIRRIEAVTSVRMVSYTETLLAEQQQIAQLMDCQPKQIEEKITKLLTDLKSLTQSIQSITTQLIHSQLNHLSPTTHPDLTYIIDCTKYGWEDIALKDIINILQTAHPTKNRIVYTAQGQYALYAGASKNAKTLQQTYKLTGGGNDQLVQGKAPLHLFIHL